MKASNSDYAIMGWLGLDIVLRAMRLLGTLIAGYLGIGPARDRLFQAKSKLGAIRSAHSRRQTEI
jgi:hypothetical protein